METLWPQADATKLGNRLSVAVSTLRLVLDPEKRFDANRFVVTEDDAVGLQNVTVDVEAFLDEAETGLLLRGAGRIADAADRLEYAEALYAGEFLEEDRYEEWAVPLREEARNAYVRVARSLADDAASAGDDGAAAAYLLRIIEREPYDEQAHLALIRVLATDRRHGDARRAYRAYVDRLAEIGLEPASFQAAIT
jgi:DNA-binding SARP family transcriptional activator